MSRIFSFLLLSASGGSADASLAALKAIDKAASVEEFSSYCEPKVSCSLNTVAPTAFGPEEMSPAECLGKITAAATPLKPMMLSINPKPLTETISGTQGVAVFGFTLCKQKGDASCVPGTVYEFEITTVYEFDDQDKVASVTVTPESALASFILSANKPVARRSATTGILITTCLVSALSISCYQLGKKHRQADASGGYTSLLDA